MLQLLRTLKKLEVGDATISVDHNTKNRLKKIKIKDNPIFSFKSSA